MNPYAPPTVDSGGREVAPITPAQRAAVEKRLKKLSSLIFLACVPGILLQGLGQDLRPRWLWLVGWLLFALGVAFYARSRGRHAAWGLLGSLSCFGMLILAILPKYCLSCTTRNSYKAKHCERCTGPLGA